MRALGGSVNSLSTACMQVLKEVRPIYKLVCEGIINLADKFFEMERGDALKGLEVYKENILMNEKLNAFFAVIQNIPPLRGAVQFPSVQVGRLTWGLHFV